MAENMEDALAALLSKVADINQNEEEEEEEEKLDPNDKQKIQTDEKKVEEAVSILKEPINKDDEDDDIYVVKKIVKIDTKQADEIRDNEIMEQVEITSKKISKDLENAPPPDDDENDEIDLDNLDIDWHFHKPSAK